jgi:hypothetical protein
LWLLWHYNLCMTWKEHTSIFGQVTSSIMSHHIVLCDIGNVSGSIRFEIISVQKLSCTRMSMVFCEIGHDSFMSYLWSSLYIACIQ